MLQARACSSRAGRPADGTVAIDVEGGSDRRTGSGIFTRAIAGDVS